MKIHGNRFDSCGLHQVFISLTLSWSQTYKYAPVVYWLGRCPFKAEKTDRNRSGVPNNTGVAQRQSTRLISDRSTSRNCPEEPSFRIHSAIKNFTVNEKKRILLYFGDVGKLVTPVDCKSAALRHCVFDSHRLHQKLFPSSTAVVALDC